MSNLALPTSTTKILSLHTMQGRGEVAAIINSMSGDLNMQKVVEAALGKPDDSQPPQPTIGKLLKYNNGIDQINSVVKACLHRFILTNFQNTDESAQEIIYDFQNEILQHRQDFTLLDVLYFFKYIRLNIGKQTDTKDFRIYGNMLTSLKLSELFTYYLDDRIAEAEMQRARKKDKQNKNITRDVDADFVVRQDADLFVRIEIKNGIRHVFDSTREEATKMKWDEAYRAWHWLSHYTECKPSILLAGDKKQSIVEYMRQRLPEFFNQKEPPLVSSAEKLDEKRSNQILEFLKKCDDISKKDKQALIKDIQARKKNWEDNKKADEARNKKFVRDKAKP